MTLCPHYQDPKTCGYCQEDRNDEAERWQDTPEHSLTRECVEAGTDGPPHDYDPLACTCGAKGGCGHLPVHKLGCPQYEDIPRVMPIVEDPPPRGQEPFVFCMNCGHRSMVLTACSVQTPATSWTEEYDCQRCGLMIKIQHKRSLQTCPHCGGTKDNPVARCPSMYHKDLV